MANAFAKKQQTEKDGLEIVRMKSGKERGRKDSVVD